MTDAHLQLEFRQQDHWPPLAWLAICRAGRSSVVVEHGIGVETRSDWFAEAVWDGDFEKGNFDDTDLIFGSGGRLRETGVTFVPSSSTIDRLQFASSGDCVFVSNSLPCLLEACGASVELNNQIYFAYFEQSVVQGIAADSQSLPGVSPAVEIVCFHNLQWTGDRLERTQKPLPKRDFSSFERYVTFMETTLCELSDNMRASQRTWTFELLATISSGYDSATIAAIARCAGLTQTLSVRQSRDHEDDSGEHIARALGLDPLAFDSNAWRSTSLAEIPFLAGDAKGEDVYYASAGDTLRGRVLLTGYGGTGVWGMGDSFSTGYQRTDQSGLSLTEYRLHCGFLHCPVTYIGGRQTADLFRISNSSEMSPWDVPGDYSRPICRRILEETGVERDAFGQSKKAASILFFDRRSFLSETSMTDFERWMQSNEIHFRDSLWITAGRAVARFGQTAARVCAKRLPGETVRRFANSVKLTQFGQHDHRFGFLFPWAMEHARLAYRKTEQPNSNTDNARDDLANVPTREPNVIQP